MMNSPGKLEHLKVLLVSVTIAFISVFLYSVWKNMLWLYFYMLLSVSCCCIGPLVLILVHIALSPEHQTGAGTSKTIVEMDTFRTMLMVS